jgi:hypothetical protein
VLGGSTSETEIIESHRFSFWCMGRNGLPRFDGPVPISDMRILGPALTPCPMSANRSNETPLRLCAGD